MHLALCCGRLPSRRLEKCAQFMLRPTIFLGNLDIISTNSLFCSIFSCAQSPLIIFWEPSTTKSSSLSRARGWRDTFPNLICRDSRYGQTGATCCERKGPTAYSISFLVGCFRRIILKCDNEASTKALQDAVIQTCARVEVIPQGPPEGDHMANGRVEMAVREVKRQCRTLQISGEQNTSVRIADDSPLLGWLPRFSAQVMNKMGIGKDGKNERTETNWTKMEKANGAIWRESLVS